MRAFNANITYRLSTFLNETMKNIDLYETANQVLYEQSGIIRFFDNDNELVELKNAISIQCDTLDELDRTEYGDFQTNLNLANQVAGHLLSKIDMPNVIIEPTCGKGNFILASLKYFPQAKIIYGIEIYKPYVWECKFNIIDFYLDNPQPGKPDISIIHSNVFNFNFEQIKEEHSQEKILITGNPPWVTNSKLGCLNSDNLPEKANFKNHNGIDAITGKGNFDIAEYITMSLIETFQKTDASIALLVKNTVIKNIVFEQYRNKHSISGIEKHSIDSKKEFNVSVEASLFYCKLNSPVEGNCTEFDFYANTKPVKKFGWVGQKFVANINNYLHSKEIDGECPFVWRQGLKHDCSTIMELERLEGQYINSLNERAVLEDELVYALLKSSDLKNTVINQPRKFTIVTQKMIGQETNHIKRTCPNTYQYLFAHKEYFDARKSSIYNNKPLFSIFGIGDYSFAPYKVAISGLYKTFHFTLILPFENKPVMLDDTCYFIGFGKLEYAVYALILLNSEKAMSFLQSITFPDAKRTFTKDVLMRINLFKLAEEYEKYEIQNELVKLNAIYNFTLALDLWDEFLSLMKPVMNRQTELAFV
ncbi:restriction endonuclease NspV [Bacteroidia bacterium]|nr:restriction endonuclease NspV [Bacteroidia bacterium]